VDPGKSRSPEMLMQDNCQPIRENKVNREKELAKKERARPLPFFMQRIISYQVESVMLL
jgi:hypothetical protein